MPEKKNAALIGINRAKTAWQLKRNGYLKKAADALKKDSRAQGKAVNIEWKIEGGKDRSVKIGDQVAFLQNSTDAIGSFVADFQNVSF